MNVTCARGLVEENWIIDDRVCMNPKRIGSSGTTEKSS